MDTDDVAPPPAPPLGLLGRNLDGMSLADLADYIEQLKAEQARAEAMIEAKKAARAGAESIFGG
ncbi:DUF1192 family protein [Roseospirillum parvum]|uniref:Uncharacterized small protein, DUF1192 family n=1 Tax=Roseospirillum parvum TaxID=83401 RepID=A0A1G7WBM4_9PROT|nr:DUF1192 family protein [Roseospirillum parvum]SDG69294.1 Uncharacterized small protein, DUF1192 family [Roseospirillum parvum]